MHTRLCEREFDCMLTLQRSCNADAALVLALDFNRLSSKGNSSK